jgi:predicted nucleic acid-binding Zn ribbon protein
MARVLGRLGAPTTTGTLETVFGRWPEVAGPALVDHVRPVRVDGAVLVVAVDHPAWATKARMGAAGMVGRLADLGETSIQRVEVVVERR